MRIAHGLAAVTCILLWVHGGQHVLAQGYPPPGYAPQGYAPQGYAPQGHAPPGYGQSGYAGRGTAPAAYVQPGQAPPGYGPSAGPPGTPATPSSLAPFPSNSMFDFRYRQVYHENGLWHQVARNRPRQAYFNFDFLSVRTRRPLGFVGNRQALTYKDIVLPILEEDPYDLGGTTGGGGQSQGNVIDMYRGFPEAGIDGFRYYDAVNFGSAFKEDMSGNGLRMQYGYTDPDDSGFGIEVFGHGISEQYDARDLMPPGRGDQKDLLLRLLRPPDFLLNDITPEDADLILQNNLLNLNGLPLDDGSIAGVTAPYDLEYKLQARSETFGASLTWTMSPSIRKERFMVRPTFGIRYLQVRETFRFDGQDSGLSYDNLEDLEDPFFSDVKLHSVPDNFDGDQDGIIDNAGMQEPVGGTGGGGGDDDEFRFIIYNDPTLYPMTAYLENIVRSTLIGPEIGLRYELGGRKFKLWGQTKLGVLANREKISMRGDNIGMTTRQDNFNLPTPTDAHPNRFKDNDSHSHVSPLIEQSIFVEFPLFSWLPVVRRVKILRRAKFRLGYTFLFVGELARPYESVIWQGHPAQDLYPGITVDRSNWFADNVSYSINWSF